MRVAVPVRENHVWIHLFSDVLEEILYLSPDIREETVSEALEGNIVLGIAGKKIRCLRGFAAPKPRSAENDPTKFQSRIGLLELQKRPAAADLDVVAMRAEAQDRQSLRIVLLEVEREHARATVTVRLSPGLPFWAREPIRQRGTVICIAARFHRDTAPALRR